MRQEDSPLPLSGLRVVDLTRILAGPFCSMLLGDMGAEVIKVEPPGEGDPIRQQGTIVDGLSWYFAQFNRNKKSITLDLYAEEGKAILARLLERADVLVENYRPGVLARMGFGEARLAALNPDLIVCGINGYGSTGPYAERPAFDFIAQAMSGFMSVNGREGEAPMRAATPISDLVAGLYGAFGVACALVARRGNVARGQRVESSLVNGLISMMAYLSAQYLGTGQLPRAPATSIRSRRPTASTRRRTARWPSRPAPTTSCGASSARSTSRPCSSARSLPATPSACSTATPSMRWSASASAPAPSRTGSSI